MKALSLRPFTLVCFIISYQLKESKQREEESAAIESAELNLFKTLQVKMKLDIITSRTSTLFDLN